MNAQLCKLRHSRKGGKGKMFLEEEEEVRKNKIKGQGKKIDEKEA
jgi:hypothetical protein